MPTEKSLLLVTKKPLKCVVNPISLANKWADHKGDTLIVYNYKGSEIQPDFLEVEERTFQRCCEMYYLDISERQLVCSFSDYLSEHYTNTIVEDTNVDAYKWALAKVLSLTRKVGWILDLGAGHGFGLKIYDEIPHGQVRLVALDMSLNMLRHCPEGSERIAGDAFALPLSDQCLSGVIVVYMLHYLSNPENVVKEIARTLVPEGICSFVIYRHDPRKMQYSEYLKASGFGVIQHTTCGCEPSEHRIVASKLREDKK